MRLTWKSLSLYNVGTDKYNCVAKSFSPGNPECCLVIHIAAVSVFCIIFEKMVSLNNDRQCIGLGMFVDCCCYRIVRQGPYVRHIQD